MLAEEGSLTIEPNLISNDSKIIEYLVNFFYTGLEGISKNNLSSQNLIQCLEATNYFLVKSPTFNFLIENAISKEGITIENCFSILQVTNYVHNLSS